MISLTNIRGVRRESITAILGLEEEADKSQQRRSNDSRETKVEGREVSVAAQAD